MNRLMTSKEERRRKDFVWVERISTLLDSNFSIGGFRFGLDPLLNLIPYAGQFVAFAVSLLLVIVMFRNGAGGKVVVKMLLNVIYDALLGAIPLFGHVFDFFNKANTKNIKLLREHYFEDKHQGRATGILVTIMVILLAISILTFYLIWLIASWFWGLLVGVF
ncbi:MAG TPA: DUF4112 domain-containing protein [Sphingobacterium sp.]|nr:DUF4112 domain-containing protein [Sphingobacterium sp.]